MIIVQATGQTCNQFWIYSNYLADTIETHEKFAIWVPDRGFETFTNLLNSKYIIYPLYSKRLVNLIGFNIYVNILTRLFCNKYSLSIFKYGINRFTNHSFVIADVLIKKSTFKYQHLDKLIFSFIPSQSIVKNVEGVIRNIKKKNDLIIGIHLRRGDYKTYQNGKFFYSNLQYSTIIEQVLRIFNNNKLAFLLVSNEEIDRTVFDKYNCYFSSNSLLAQDLYLLGQSDYILGPPSTFSAWASLYNSSPLYFVENPEFVFSINDFIDIKSSWF